MSFITCNMDPIKKGDHIMLVQLVKWSPWALSGVCELASRQHLRLEDDCGILDVRITANDLWRILHVTEAEEFQNLAARYTENIFSIDTNHICVVPTISFVKIHPDNINNKEYLDAVKTIFNNRYYEEFPDEYPE